MITTLTRIWHQRWHRAEIRRLAERVGPHLARDIGIDTAEMPERRNRQAAPVILAALP